MTIKYDGHGRFEQQHVGKVTPAEMLAYDAQDKLVWARPPRRSASYRPDSIVFLECGNHVRVGVERDPHAGEGSRS